MVLGLLIISGLAVITGVRTSDGLEPSALADMRFEILEETLEAQAVALRREEVVVAPWSGRLNRLVAHGERVRVGLVVAELTNQPVGATAEAGRKEALTGLSSWSEAKAARMESLRASIKIHSGRIGELFDEVVHSAAGADRGDLHRSLEALERQTAQNREEEKELETLERAKSKLLARKGQAEEARNRANLRLKAPEAGIVSYQVDGLEEKYGLNSRGDLKVSDLTGDSESLMSDPESQTASVGQPVFKVVDAQELFLAVALNPGQNPALAAGSKVRVRLPSGIEEEARVERLGAREPDGRALLILQTPNLSREMALWRSSPVTVVLRRAEGPTAPATSLVTRDGQDGVFVVIGGQAFWKPVKAGAIIGGRVTLPQFNPGTTLVIDPSRFKPGQKVP